MIGCEIGQFLARMGSEVTIIEMQERILSTCDEDMVKPLVRQFKKDSGTYKTGTFDFKALGKAQASGHIFGSVRIITDNSDKIIGGAITGQNASDMLSVITTAVALGLTAEELGDVIYPHLTMSEAIMEALHDLHGMSIGKA